MATDDLVTIYSASDSTTGEIIKNFLEGEGITCFLENENQGGFEGITGMAVHVQVPAGSADYARKLLKQHEPHKKK
jgi:Putative prokaryotic signal transducing protein